LLDCARHHANGGQDFEGQHLAELVTTVLLGVSGIIAFLVGYVQQDIYQTLWIGLGGTALTFIAVVPSWSFYTKNPVAWLPPHNATSGLRIDVDGNQVG
ncbi:SPC12-domain-containing protein, partial [Mytilinidion resinicola]